MQKGPGSQDAGKGADPLALGRGPADLLPLVYDELRRMAARAMRHERPDHTLQSTALVHEAWARLVGNGEVEWENRAHFFTAAAEAMRRILVEHARARARLRRGGPGRRRLGVDVASLAAVQDPPTFLRLEQAFSSLEAQAPAMADVARLRLFAGLGVPETATALGISTATVKRRWAYSRAWLQRAFSEGSE
ncbi:MAG: RNA polymerase subunit sigma [Phycisphaerales bacterium]|nr:RNA polymerase subunit sigma [Phycisphaerales bacterium]